MTVPRIRATASRFLLMSSLTLITFDGVSIGAAVASITAALTRARSTLVNPRVAMVRVSAEVIRTIAAPLEITANRVKMTAATDGDPVDDHADHSCPHGDTSGFHSDH